MQNPTQLTVEKSHSVSAAIESRRSVKHFDPDHRLPAGELDEMLRLVRLTPTSYNLQNYRFLVVEDPEVRRQIRAVAYDQSQMTDASALIVVCGNLNAHVDDPERYWQHAGPEVREMMVSMLGDFYRDRPSVARDEAMRSAGMAAMSLMLLARENGYDTCAMIGFDPEAVAEIINLPQDHAIGMMVALGRKVRDAWPRGDRLPADEVVLRNRFEEGV